MAPRENDMLEIVQRLESKLGDITFEKRKGQIDLWLKIGLPTFAVLSAAAAFYFNSQSDIKNMQKEIMDLKTQLAQVLTLDRQRMLDEIARLNRQVEKTKP